MLKRILIVSAFVLSFSAQGQCCGKKTANFLGINPSVTIEPFYEKGEFDLNVFPIVYQKTLTKRFDFRISTTLNYGVRKTSKTISHIGGQLALPIYFMKKNELINPSSGFFLAPGVGFTRNTLEKHSNIGVWLEPGYNLQISEKWTISFGIQLGATHFNYDNGIRKWGNHFGIKIFLGRWF
jgi:hypothetical protein